MMSEPESDGVELTPEEAARLAEPLPTTEELSVDEQEEERRLYGLGR